MCNFQSGGARGKNKPAYVPPGLFHTVTCLHSISHTHIHPHVCSFTHIPAARIPPCAVMEPPGWSLIGSDRSTSLGEMAASSLLPSLCRGGGGEGAVKTHSRLVSVFLAADVRFKGNKANGADVFSDTLLTSAFIERLTCHTLLAHDTHGRPGGA